MKWFLFNIGLATAGSFLAQHFTAFDFEKPLDFFVVFSSAFIFFWLLSFFFARKYFYKVPKVLKFIVYISKELVISNLRITHDILTPVHRMNPAILAIPLDVKTDIEITLLAVLLNFTPGTLCLKVSADKKILYVHEMYIPGNDTEAVKKKIKESFERRILELTK